MRLSKITTRTGDKGTTGLADGTRLGKDHARIASLGSVDELNSQLGVLLAEEIPQDIRPVLLQIQNDLFDLGGTLALPTQDVFPESKVAWLDEQLAHYNAGLPPLREFILPGGSRAGTPRRAWRRSSPAVSTCRAPRTSCASARRASARVR